MSTSNNTGLLVLVVDDEPAGILEVKICLDVNREVRRVLTAGDATEALRLLNDDYEVGQRRDKGLPLVDAVFADISMPGLTGIEMAKVFAGFKPPPVLVFVTGEGGGDAVHAFELGAVDYILKPVQRHRVEDAIGRVLAKIRGDGIATTIAAAPAPVDDEVIPVELAGTTKLISRQSVRWVEAQGDYARLFTLDGSHLVRIPLAQLEERWEKAGFVRIHRSYLVPINLITELRMGNNGYSVMIGHNEKLLPVSRRHTRELKDRLVRRE